MAAHRCSTEIELVHRSSSRRFPAPWRADKIAGAMSGHSNDQALANIYSRENEADARQFKNESDKARRVAMVFARPPKTLAATAK